MLKWIFFALASVMLLFTSVIGLLQIDDDLTPELVEFLAITTPKSENNAYFYLLGFGAAEEDNPVDVGKTSFAQIQQQEVAIKSQLTDEAFIDFTPVNTLPTTQNDLFCRYDGSQCLSTLFNNLEKIPALIATHQLYLSRYYEFVAMQNYQTLTEPSVYEPTVNFTPLVTAVRLIHLEQIYLASQGDSEQAINRLLVTHAEIRQQLIQQDTFIGKLFLLPLLSENIDLIYLLSRKKNSLDKVLLEPLHIAPLTSQERNLLAVFSREARSMNFLYQSLDKSPHIFDSTNSEDSFHSPPWLTRLLFKPNMTSNHSYKPLFYFAQLSVLELAAFTTEMEKATTFTGAEFEVEPHWIRNVIGTILVDIASPDYSTYIYQFWNLNNKINLFNEMVNKANNSTHFEQVSNLYPSLSGEHAYLSENQQSICLASPIDGKQHYSCLPLAMNAIKGNHE